MVCIYCGSNTGVVNSRRQNKQNTTWRRRKCKSCGALFTSRESLDLAASLMVTDTTSHLEPFWRDKLLISLYDSLKHRKTATQDASALCDTVCGLVLARVQHAKLSTDQINTLVLEVLQRFDNAAATHYQAFHQL